MPVSFRKGMVSVSRTKKMDVVLKLNRYSEKSANHFHSQVESMAGEKAEVKARKQKVVIECTELDESTSRQNICVELREPLNRTMQWTEYEACCY